MADEALPGGGAGDSRVVRGFTLSEVVAVVAIIALLIAILLPSLRQAREQARAVVCAANLGTTCEAEAFYQSESKGWIPGSPWTTGYWFLTSPGGSNWDPDLPGFNRLAVNMFDYVTPLRAVTLGGRAVGRDRRDLILNMTGGSYSCPSSNEWAFPFGDPTYPKIKAVSHMTMTSFMNAGPDKYREVAGNPAMYPGITKAGWAAQADSFSVVPRAGYMPRHDHLGWEQFKIFVADGLRFFDEGTQTITYTTFTNLQAKMMTCATPPSTGGTEFSNGREYNLARRYSYRHGTNNRIQAGFFDGHVEGLSLGRDRTPKHFTGKVVHPQYYYPSGSVVRIPADLHRNDILAGTVLP